MHNCLNRTRWDNADTKRFRTKSQPGDSRLIQFVAAETSEGALAMGCSCRESITEYSACAVWVDFDGHFVANRWPS